MQAALEQLQQGRTTLVIAIAYLPSRSGSHRGIRGGTHTGRWQPPGASDAEPAYKKMVDLQFGSEKFQAAEIAVNRSASQIILSEWVNIQLKKLCGIIQLMEDQLANFTAAALAKVNAT